MGSPPAGASSEFSGDGTLELSDLIAEAIRNNPELHAYRARSKAARARVWQAVSWDDTVVGADFEGIPGGRIDADRAKDIEWMISQKIPFPGKRFLKGRVRAKEAEMTKEDYRAKEREVVNEIKRAYFDYFLGTHEISLHAETRRILERLAISAESLYATGRMPYAEILAIHSELARITNEVAKHGREQDVARARLYALLGRDLGEPLSISIAIPVRNFSYTKEDLIKLVLEHRPELRAVRLGAEAAKTDAQSAWFDLLPDGEVRIEARRFSGEGGIREYDQFFGFEVPVLSLVGRVGRIKEKSAEKRAAHMILENMKNIVLYEVQEALAEFESSERTAQMYEANAVPQAESAFHSSLASYESGQGGFRQVMEAAKTLTEFRHHYFESVVMREQSFSDLERVVGMDLGGGVLT